MLEIEIEKKPNQKFSTQIGDDIYYIQLRQGKYSMLVSIYRGEEPLIEGHRLVINTGLIGYDHLKTDGDFYLYSLNNKLANFEDFGVTQFLYYVYDSELA